MVLLKIDSKNRMIGHDLATKYFKFVCTTEFVDEMLSVFDDHGYDDIEVKYVKCKLTLKHRVRIVVQSMLWYITRKMYQFNYTSYFELQNVEDDLDIEQI